MKRIILAAALALVGLFACRIGFLVYHTPTGQWERWLNVHSPSEHRRVKAWKFDGIWYEDITGAPSPFDPPPGGGPIEFRRLSGRLLEEVLREEAGRPLVPGEKR